MDRYGARRVIRDDSWIEVIEAASGLVAFVRPGHQVARSHGDQAGQQRRPVDTTGPVGADTEPINPQPGEPSATRYARQMSAPMPSKLASPYLVSQFVDNLCSGRNQGFTRCGAGQEPALPVMFRDMRDASDASKRVCDALAKFCFQGVGTHKFHGPDIDRPPIPVARPANHLLLPIGDPACSYRADLRLVGFPEPFFEDLGIFRLDLADMVIHGRIVFAPTDTPAGVAGQQKWLPSGLGAVPPRDPAQGRPLTLARRLAAGRSPQPICSASSTMIPSGPRT